MTDEQARAILSDPSADPSDRAEALAVLAEPLTLDDEYGCDPWSDEHHGRHPASRDF